MKKVSKFVIAGMLGFILSDCLRDIIKANSHKPTIPRHRRRWIILKLSYSNSTPPPYIYYSEGGYHGYLQYMGLSNRQWIAKYGGYISKLAYKY